MKKEQIRVVVRAVILRENHLLIARCKGALTTFLPGGHVEFGESLPTALARELAEEVGLTIRVSRYLGAVEHQWSVEHQLHHQINHIFEASLPNTEGLPCLTPQEAHLEFFWVPLAELPCYKLLPSPLMTLVYQVNAGDRQPFWASTFAASTHP